jgi:hypothetical protein
MNLTLRRATESDVPDLVRLFIMATDGIVDVLYHDLVPGVPTEELFEWRFTQAGSVKSYEYCWVTQQGSPIIPRPLIHHTGDLLLMMRRL